jgi:phage baseplate assembly protein W
MQQIGYPYHFDVGHTAEVTQEEHIREMIKQVLFTSPGERVNQPTFGCGLLQLLFEPNNDVLAAATQFSIQGALQQWLGELIQVEGVEVRHGIEDNGVWQNEEQLTVVVQYTIRRTQQQNIDQFTREGL